MCYAELKLALGQPSTLLCSCDLAGIMADADVKMEDGDPMEELRTYFETVSSSVFLWSITLNQDMEVSQNRGTPNRPF